MGYIQIQMAIERGVCIECHRPAKYRIYSYEGEEEYKISGLCETCYDRMHGTATGGNQRMSRGG